MRSNATCYFCVVVRGRTFVVDFRFLWFCRKLVGLYKITDRLSCVILTFKIMKFSWAKKKSHNAEFYFSFLRTSTEHFRHGCHVTVPGTAQCPLPRNGSVTGQIFYTISQNIDFGRDLEPKFRSKSSNSRSFRIWIFEIPIF